MSWLRFIFIPWAGPGNLARRASPKCEIIPEVRAVECHELFKYQTLIHGI